MTEKQINEIKVLNLEIKRINDVLRSIANERETSKKAEYLAMLESNKEKFYECKILAEKLIREIDDAEIRLIFSLKFIDLKSWNYIARYMHYDRTTVYKKYKNYIRRINNEK